MKSIRIVTTNCKRCGRPISTSDKSHYGMDVQKNAFGDVCKNCITEIEQHEMLKSQGQGIVKHLTDNK